MMSSLISMLVLYVISTGLVQLAQGDLYCENETCVGDDFYCCNGYCCEDTDNDYDWWWFWLIIWLGCISCCIKGCRYNTNRNPDYQRIVQVPTPTTYNSVTPRPPPPPYQVSEVIAPPKPLPCSAV